jgi:hypothetical protein
MAFRPAPWIEAIAATIESQKTKKARWHISSTAWQKPERSQWTVYTRLSCTVHKNVPTQDRGNLLKNANVH